MKDIEFCQMKLTLQTHAADSRHEIDGNYRVCYYLLFREKVGWDWVKAQVNEISDKLNVDLQMWKIHSCDDGYEISVKEVEKRESVVSGQGDLRTWT